MPNAPLVPTVRGVLLGRALRRVRSEAGMNLEGAAAALGWNPSKLSRVENGRQHILPEEIAGLFKAYGAANDSETVAGFERLAREAMKRAGWWRGFGDVLTTRYADRIALETEAEAVRVYAPLVVPGLLQTAVYAQVVTGGTAFTRTPEEVTALVDVRQARQAVLSRPERALRYRAIIEEGVLRRSFRGHPGVMRDQMQRLLDTAAKPNVTIQVMPSDVDPHPGCAGGFELVSLSPPMPELIVELETLQGSSYLDDSEHVALWDAAWREIAKSALSASDSLAFMERLKEGLR